MWLNEVIKHLNGTKWWHKAMAKTVDTKWLHRVLTQINDDPKWWKSDVKRWGQSDDKTWWQKRWNKVNKQFDDNKLMT